MAWLDRMERKLGWLAFPGFLRYYALLHALVYVLQIFRPDIGTLLEFNRTLILQGEVWRLVTFLFASSGFGGAGMFGMILMFFMVMIAFLISDALEGEWGVFRTSLFYYMGISGLLVANFLYGGVVQGSGFFLYEAAFFAFATLFPRVEFLLFMIIPVQVRILAIIAAVLIVVFPLVAQPVLFPYYLLGFGNYLIFSAIPAWRGRAQLQNAAQRRKVFQQSLPSEEQAFHHCKTCERTEISDPQLEFRIGGDGEEYCVEHLPKG
ncbi:MAG: hypothetical protein QM627_01430 [Luteolibacter sp.]